MESDYSREQKLAELSSLTVKFMNKKNKGRRQTDNFKLSTHVNSTYDDSNLGRTRFTNLSTNQSQDDTENKSRLPEVVSGIYLKHDSILKNKIK